MREDTGHSKSTKKHFRILILTQSEKFNKSLKIVMFMLKQKVERNCLPRHASQNSQCPWLLMAVTIEML